MATNLSNDNVSLQTKIKLLEEEFKNLKKVTSRSNLKLSKTYQDLKIDTVKIPLLIKIR